MAKAAGREAVLKKNSTAIGGVRVKNLTRDTTPINVTDDDSDGLQELLAVAGMSVLGFDVEGVLDDTVLEAIAFSSSASQLLTDLEFELNGGNSITGNFFMTSYKQGMDYKEATTFSASFTSSGAWTYA
jgi:predicted secreted protein